MSESSQRKVGRNRPPRVQITYDVEIGNAIEKKEIPFVMGILANLSGYGDKPPIKADAPNFIALKDRQFVEIDRDNFGDILAQLAPKVEVAGATFQFKSLDDFRPDKLVGQMTAPLPAALGFKGKSVKDLWEERQMLRDMLTKLDDNDELEGVWTQADPAALIAESAGYLPKTEGEATAQPVSEVTAQPEAG